MKEFRFKLLAEGEKLCYFGSSELIVKTLEGNYKIYRLEGFDEGAPSFYKRPTIVQVLELNEVSSSILCKKVEDEYWIFKVNHVSDNSMEVEKSFAVVVRRGVGKIEVYDTETRITANLPAKESK